MRVPAKGIIICPYLTNPCANASIVVGPWNFSVPELPKWIQPELKLFTISI